MKVSDWIKAIIFSVLTLLAAAVLTGSIIISWTLFIIIAYVELRIIPALKTKQEVR
jgi:hypothetical protein